ncbi:MFS general substrate transporter [Periconia macrospinosa]|uniref:MFS general substrate transporter n=1 Tax=Periconia macrospinosa TaxID=97972 RepID=A0A2V1DDN7_9PLEO|nr:MFS general substrate transporter [Periconia macrospinosa]
MALGILEDRKLEHVPGTANVLEDDRIHVRHEERDGRLKYDKTGKILLVPQPSDDPNDPLNWPLWKRDTITAILSLISILASTLSPLLAATTASLAITFTRTFTEMALLTGYHLLGVGFAGLLFVPSARIWGKRHLYLFGAILVIASSIWGGASGPRNYKSLLWARIFQGIGLAPFEALVNASVGDLYFVHERGARMALSNLALFGGAFFTPVLVGKIAESLGWEWTFYFVAIFAAAVLPGVVLFCPETTFRRESRFEIDTMGNLVGAGGGEGKGESEGSGADGEVRRREVKEKACLIQGTLIGWTVLIGVVLAGIFLGPPLWFTEVETGYMYTGAFIGALVGFLLCGLLSDSSARFLTRRNHGVYEPEFRLVLVIPQLILGGAGLYGFGWMSADVARYGWVWVDFWFGCEVAGMVCGAVASALYVVDAHRDMSVEAFTCLLVFKNIFSFGLTFKGFDWIVAGGIRPVFIYIASVQVAICALTIPMLTEIPNLRLGPVRSRHVPKHRTGGAHANLSCVRHVEYQFHDRHAKILIFLREAQNATTAQEFSDDCRVVRSLRILSQ